jgi:hypothetical protein
VISIGIRKNGKEYWGSLRFMFNVAFMLGLEVMRCYRIAGPGPQIQFQLAKSRML